MASQPETQPAASSQDKPDGEDKPTVEAPQESEPKESEPKDKDADMKPAEAEEPEKKPEKEAEADAGEKAPADTETGGEKAQSQEDAKEAEEGGEKEGEKEFCDHFPPVCLAAAMTCEGEGSRQCKRPRTQANEDRPWHVWGSGRAEVKSELNAMHGIGSLCVAACVEDATEKVSCGAHGIISGIAFLDHMIDQLTAHAQVRVSLHVSVGGRAVEPHSNELGKPGVDVELARLAGKAVGESLKVMLLSGGRDGCLRQLGAEWDASKQHTVLFCAPLDEAVTEVALELHHLQAGKGLAEIGLAPYGIYPKGGRKYIGSFQTALTEVFFVHLADALGCRMVIKKVRGDNAHHIVEASFKCFARCLRRAMDQLVDFDPVAHSALLAIGARKASRKRTTKETSISVELNLNPGPEDLPGQISTGIAMLDTMLCELQTHSKVHLAVSCVGDTWIDEHHCVEDVAITVGKTVAEALGDKAGVVRMGYADGSCGMVQLRCVMDLSNRPYFQNDPVFEMLDEEKVDDVSVEMIQHFFESFVTSALMTVHFCHQHCSDVAGVSARDLVIAATRSLGSALAQCVAIDPRRAGAVSSSKGTLSK